MVETDIRTEGDSRAKRVLKTIFKIFWILLGCFLVLLIIISFIHAKTFSGSGFSAIGEGIAAGVFIGIALGGLAIYIVATGLFFLIRWIIKKVRKKND